MVSLMCLKEIAEKEGNCIAGNLLPLLGYEDTEETSRLLKENGIEKGEDILERSRVGKEEDILEKRGIEKGVDILDGSRTESGSRKILSNQEALFYTLTIRSIRNPRDIRRLDLMSTMLAAYEPYIRRQAVKLARGNMNIIDDLRQEGAIALHRAILKYDPERSPFFAGYANGCICHAMNRAYYSQINPFKWSENVEKKTLRLKGYAESSGISQWDAGSIEKASDELGISPSCVRKYVSYFRCLNMMYFEGSGDNIMGRDHEGLRRERNIRRAVENVLRAESAEDEYLAKTAEDRVRGALGELSEIEAEIMKDYAGLNEAEPELKGNVAGIGRKYGEKRYEMDKKIMKIRSKLLKLEL